MKRLFIISLLFLSVGFGQKKFTTSTNIRWINGEMIETIDTTYLKIEYNIENLLVRDDVYVKKFSDEILNGEVFKMFGEMKVPLGNMKDGKKEGKWADWYENGHKKQETTFKDGKPDGLVTAWYENGQKKRERTFKDGKLDGLKTYWNEYGQVVEETVFDLGNLMNKKEYDYYPTGEVYTIETNEGIITYYSIKGEIEKETKNGKIWNGKLIEWWNDDNKKKEISYKDGKLNGLYTEWDKNSNKIKEGSYVNELMEGEWYFYFFNIVTKRWESMTGSFKSGDGGNLNENSGVPMNGRHGLFTSFLENGQKKQERTFKDGELDGISTWWYENGQKKQEGTFKDGKGNGLATSWHENGQKKQEGTFKDGKGNGLATSWHENGQKKQEGT
ncbi:MAG: toxin-antitoxin system YwqK family antitoxin, partial [Candidatus Marinimicrobia bacterium]|nr:toxin-antitoxin system YwqK family antitoxin [Candidatus Neomarinimicrobiota bacterium]